jgi:hypothetical protein
MEAGTILVEDRAPQLVAALRGRNRELMMPSQAKMNLWLRLAGAQTGRLYGARDVKKKE